MADPGTQMRMDRLRQEFNDWLPTPHQPWGKQAFGERFEGHEALGLDVTRALHPKTRRDVFRGLVLGGRK